MIPQLKHNYPSKSWTKRWPGLLSALGFAAVSQLVTPTAGIAQTPTSELKQWHKVTFEFDGPNTSETATPNPFSDYRLDVTFTHTNTGESYVVPGFYAADGNAAESSADSGNKWHVNFSPPLTGDWSYVASFRTGTNIAASTDAGTSAGFFDGASGTFNIGASDKTGRDFRGKGWLQYTEEHYPRFKGSNELFVKQGPDSPENLLAYEDFDATPNTGQRLKSWSPHAGDYQSADASEYTWQGGKGSELLGAIRYLADDEGMNSISFLTFNIDGDDDNVFPHLLNGTVSDYKNVSDDQRWNSGVVYKDRFDVSKMTQWGKIFSYADKKGVFLHFKTQEKENDDRMDGGALGVERTLYYRELIARFGHHLALNWNLGEENSNTTSERIAFTEYFYSTDPYGNPVVLHTWPGQQENIYRPLLGDSSKLSGASIQTNNSTFSSVHSEAAQWVEESRLAGKPWMVAVDEPGDPGNAIRPDSNKGSSHEDGRKNALWGTFLAGGWGNEWYFGYNHPNSDLSLQDFRSRDQWWDYCRIALEFFENNPLPLTAMINDNNASSASDDYCYYSAGDTYLVYLKNGGSTDLNLSTVSGEFTVQWYDTRNGGSLQTGSVQTVNGGGWVSLGTPPSAATEDWLIVVDGDGEIVRRSPENPSPTVNGIEYGYYTQTGMNSVTDLPATADSTGTASNFSLSATTTQADNFGYIFSGFIDVPTDDDYTFYTSSDDGSVLLIGSQIVVDNDGTHAMRERSGTIGLKAGKHAIQVQFFEASGGENLVVSYESSSIAKQVIPDSVLYRVETVSGKSPYLNSSVDLPGRIEAEYYDFGGQGVSYNDDAQKNGNGSFRPDDNVDVQNSLNAEAGGKNVGWTSPGEWLEYMVNIPEGTYDIHFRMASENDNRTMQISLDGQVLGIVDCPNESNGWQDWRTATLPSVEITEAMAGSDRVIRLEMIDGGFNVNWVEFEALTPPVPDVAINAGGSVTGDFDADYGFSSGGTYSTGATIDMSLASNPAPQAVYQTERYGSFSYTVPGLTPNTDYTVRLHFAEIYFGATGKRVFDVNINGAVVLPLFDIVADAGAKNTAVVKEFTVNSGANGEIVISTNSVIENPKISGIEVL